MAPRDRVELPQAARQAHDEALDHAADLLSGAQLLADGFAHLAYHLAVLALEEVGRASLIVMQAIADGDDGGARRFERAAADHVRKLFWALWGPSFGRELITREQIEEIRGLATAIHETRLAGLYYGGPDTTPPRDAIDAAEATTVLKLARSRLELERAHDWVQPDSDQAADLAWFIEATADPETRRMIVGNASMRKLTELGSAPRWIHWLHREFERAETAGREVAERELARTEPGPDERADPKWRLKVRLQSASHSIRPAPLQWWNDLGAWLQFHAVPTDRDQLIAEFTLPKAVSIQALWFAGLAATHQLLLALNIASAGFFWWHMPDKVSRFYEQLTDLETNERLQVERAPALRVDWGHHALTRDVLGRVALCLGHLPKHDDANAHQPFNHYLTGLAFMAKTDVTIQFEANAFEQFYRALKGGSALYGTWNQRGSFVDHLDQIAARYFESSADRGAYLHAAEAIEAGRVADLRVDLSQVAGLKVLNDASFLAQFHELATIEDREAT